MMVTATRRRRSSLPASIVAVRSVGIILLALLLSVMRGTRASSFGIQGSPSSTANKIGHHSARSYSSNSNSNSKSTVQRLRSLTIAEIKGYASPLLIRGGSATALSSTPAAASAASSTSNDIADSQLRSYRLQQQLYLQSRSLLLRQALIQRGFDEFRHTAKDTSVATEVDWDCALATDEHPKTCLYSFDAETGCKVVAPVNTTEWIMLSALNRLRRNDPSKVEPLWHSQYHILSTWLSQAHKYSFYTHLDPVGTGLSLLLDAPRLLDLAMIAMLSVVFLITLPFWESLIQTLVCSSLLWKYWPQWGRFLHAALPLQLLLVQMAMKSVGKVWGKLYGNVRTQLVEWECRILEDCTPLTILEGVEQGVVSEEKEYSDDEDDEEEEEEASEDDSDDSESESD